MYTHKLLYTEHLRLTALVHQFGVWWHSSHFAFLFISVTACN